MADYLKFIRLQLRLRINEVIALISYKVREILDSTIVNNNEDIDDEDINDEGNDGNAKVDRSIDNNVVKKAIKVTIVSCPRERPVPTNSKALFISILFYKPE